MNDARHSLILRHPVYTRIVHWLVAIFFVLALLSGLAIYSPWLFHGLSALFGGGPATRLLHPWFSIGFVVAFVLQMMNWRDDMRWRADDREWMRHFKDYVTKTGEPEPEHVGFFNAGQKLYFWTIVVSTAVFLMSGIPMWFPATFGRLVTAIGYVLHDVAALVMLAGFIVHIYEATAAQPGTFRAMVRGTVEKQWAKFHHPAWYRQVTGDSQRDARRPEPNQL